MRRPSPMDGFTACFALAPRPSALSAHRRLLLTVASKKDGASAPSSIAPRSESTLAAGISRRDCRRRPGRGHGHSRHHYHHRHDAGLTGACTRTLLAVATALAPATTGLLRAGMRMARCITVRTACVALARCALAGIVLGLARRTVAPADRNLQFEARHIADVHVAAQQAHDRAQQLHFILRHQRNRLAGRAVAAGTTDAVHVVLGHHRQVEVDHLRQLVDVDAARSDVGGHQHGHAVGLEVAQRTQALALALVAMDRRGLDA